MVKFDQQSHDKLHPYTGHQFDGNLLEKDLLIVDNGTAFSNTLTKLPRFEKKNGSNDEKKVN